MLIPFLLLFLASNTFAQTTEKPQTQDSGPTKSQEDLDKKLESLDKDKSKLERPQEAAGKVEINSALDMQDIVNRVEKHAKVPGADPANLPSIEDLRSDDVERLVPALEKAAKIRGLENLKDMPNFAALKSGNPDQMAPEFQKLAAIKGLEGLKNLPDFAALKSGKLDQMLPEIKKIVKIPGLENVSSWPNIETLQSGKVDQILPEIQKLSQIKGLEGLPNLPDVNAIKSGDLSKMLPEVEKLATLPGLEKLNTTAGLKEITTVLPQVLKSTRDLKFHFEVANQEGWNFGIDIGVQTAWDLQRLTTGIITGQYLELGGKTVFYISLLKQNHEWRNKFYLHEALTKTPVLSDFVKSHDHLLIKTEYLWSPWSWFGVFGEASMDVAIFPGQDLQPNPVTYHIFDPTGTTEVETIPNVDRLALDGLFVPLQLAQAGGAFVRPFKQKEIWWEIKAGAYAYQTFADGALRVMNVTTTDVNIQQLQTSYQFGPSVGTDIYGILFNKFFSYTLSSRVGYVAFDTSHASQLGIGGAFNFTANASITFNPFSWIGVTVDTRSSYLPNIVADLQIANRVYLNFPFNM